MLKQINLCFLCFFAGVFVSYLMFQDREYRDPKVYYPSKPKPHFSLSNLFGTVRRHTSLHYEKQNLKILGQAWAMCYIDELNNNYISNPRDLEIDQSVFYPRYLENKYISLPKNWQMPDNWQNFNQSNSPYVFAGIGNENYTGSQDVPLFIVRNGYQAYPKFYQVVYEDGHVSKVSYSEAIKLWEKAGVWNLSE